MKKKALLFLVLVSALIASRWLFKSGYFIMHDDLQMMRQLQMEKCFKDRQFPCRWVPDMGLGYGYPLFNFYPPGPYYIGQIFRFFGFSFINTAKALFISQFFLSAIAMFVLVADLWGGWAGLISAVFYTWAPYHSLDTYVRGAMNEVWAFVWFPIILWSIRRLIKLNKTKYLLWLVFSFAMLLLTHNLMVVIFVPVLGLWTLYWLIKLKKLKKLQIWLKLSLSGVWSIGLAAFFTLPVLVEKKLVQLDTMFGGYYDWRAHFPSLKQMFLSRFWGYGASTWGLADDMAFPIGHIHWVLAGFLGLFGLFRLIKKKKINEVVLVWGLLGLGVFYAFLTHSRSTPIWLKLPILQMTQFPWRLLIIVTFCFSLLSGYLAKVTKNKKIIFLILVLVIGWNWAFFRPKAMGPLTDQQKFSGDAWFKLQVSALYDYLPKTAHGPDDVPEGNWEFLGNKPPLAVEAEKGTDWFEWQGKIQEGGVLRFNNFYFNGWKVWVDEKPADLEYDEDLGRMQVKLKPGKHHVYFKFTNTPIRAWGNLISLLSWGAFLVIVTNRRWKWLPKT